MAKKKENPRPAPSEEGISFPCSALAMRDFIDRAVAAIRDREPDYEPDFEADTLKFFGRCEKEFYGNRTKDVWLFTPMRMAMLVSLIDKARGRSVTDGDLWVYLCILSMDKELLKNIEVDAEQDTWKAGKGLEEVFKRLSIEKGEG